MGLVGRKGKLTIAENAVDVLDVAWHRYEDVLTADVFGAYRYLPPTIGLLPLLNHAVDENGQTFECYLDRVGITLSRIDIIRIRFWPTFEDGREPDVLVLLELSQSEMKVALLVEAKLHAPQHEIPTSSGDRSQLGHYLIQHLADRYADGSITWELPDQPRPLLFITNHEEVPATQLRRARVEVAKENESLSTDEIGVFWANWANAGMEARRLWRENRDQVDSSPWLRILLDLYEEIRSRDLMPRPPFAGFCKPAFDTVRLPYSRSFVHAAPIRMQPGALVRRSYAVPTPVLHEATPIYERTYEAPGRVLSPLPATYVSEEMGTR